MTEFELVDRLCAVNTLLSDIVRELAAIIAQHGITPLDGDLSGKIAAADAENDLLEAAMRGRM